MYSWEIGNQENLRKRLASSLQRNADLEAKVSGLERDLETQQKTIDLLEGLKTEVMERLEDIKDRLKHQIIANAALMTDEDPDLTQEEIDALLAPLEFPRLVRK